MSQSSNNETPIGAVRRRDEGGAWLRVPSPCERNPRLSLLLLLVLLTTLPSVWASSTPALFRQFSLGVGDRYNWDTPVGSGNYRNAQGTVDLIEARGVVPRQSRFIMIWMVQGWEPSWFSVEEVQRDILDKGYIPVFVHWWFEDDTHPDTIRRKETDYYQDMRRVGDYLNQLEGEVLLVLEPEFNTDPTDALNNWPGFSQVLLNARAEVESRLTARQTKVYYGTSPGTWDSAEEVAPAIDEFVAQSDFVGAQFLANSRLYTRQEAMGLMDLLLERQIEYHQRYGLPTLAPYVTVARFDETTGNPNGWLDVQQHIINRLVQLRERFFDEAGSFGVSWMMLADDPSRDTTPGPGELYMGLLDHNFVDTGGFSALFPDPRMNDHLVDSDGDGFRDDLEQAAGSDPLNVNSIPAGDSDGDGIANSLDPNPLSVDDKGCVPRRDGIVMLTHQQYSNSSTCNARHQILTGKAVRVTASGILTLRAGDRIQLLPGFDAVAGSRVSMEIRQVHKTGSVN